jgi:hypothetical protein
MLRARSSSSIRAVATLVARHVVHVARAHQRGDIGIVRLRGHRVAQEHDDVDAAVGQLGADLEIAAERPRQLALDLEPVRGRDAPAGRARRDQPALRERVAVLARERDDLVLLRVVRDQCDAGFAHLRFLLGSVVVGRSGAAPQNVPG